jgi:DNA replication and repair protein RecF
MFIKSSMIKKINLRNFRCHQQIDIDINQPFVYISGDNGSGKTSILESLYFVATTKSHRSSDEKELIKKNEMFTHIKVTTDQNRYEIIQTKQGKRALINGVEKRKLSDYIGALKVVLFAPEDLDLIKGTPAQRRNFMDLSWMQLDKVYLLLLNQYKNILKQRNSLLKKIKPEDDYVFLDILGEQLYESGIQIIRQRKEFIERLNTHLIETYQKFSTHNIKIIYKPDVSVKSFKSHLEKQQKQDIVYQTTMAGPHRDDFYMDFNGFDAKSYASQGEQRLIVIALKFALLKLIQEVTNDPVILLLDDVLSELDEEKQAIFLKELPKNQQIIMNSAHKINQSGMQHIHLKRER